LVSANVGNHGLARFAINVGALLHLQRKQEARSKTGELSPSIQAVEVYTIDEFIARYGAPCPNYIKIDVPGLTREIFAGATQTLANPALRQIQVEAREHKGGRRIAELLAPLGFKLMRPGMRCDGKLQSDPVFARNILGTNNVAAPAPSASNQVGFRRGAAEPSR
jgi:hypothetical protein